MRIGFVTSLVEKLVEVKPNYKSRSLPIFRCFLIPLDLCRFPLYCIVRIVVESHCLVGGAVAFIQCCSWRCTSGYANA